MNGGLVVVGIDFSELSARAVREARELARVMGVDVEAVFVVSDGPSGWEPTPEQALWLRESGLSRAAVRVRVGTPWVELARHAAERDASFVVVGTHGSGGFHPVGLGSTTARLSTACTRPVLVVGRRSPPRTALAAAL